MNTLAIVRSLVEARFLVLEKSWDPELHPRVPGGVTKGGEFTSKGKVFSPVSSGDEIITKEERYRYRELEDRYDSLTPEEKKEYEQLSKKLDDWFTHQANQRAEDEKKAEEKKYRDRLKHDAEVVAKALDFDPDNVIYTDETLGFTLNDKHLVAGGHVERGGEKVYIHVNDLRTSDLDQYTGMVAHEIEHAKFNHFLKAYEKDRDLMMKDPGPVPDPNAPYWWGKRGGTDAMMKASDGTLRPPYDEKYPMYTLYQKVLGSIDNLIKGDGCTTYSYDNWKAWRAGKKDTTGAIHETLAEMSMIRYKIGKFPGPEGYYGWSSLDWRTKNAMYFGFKPPESRLDDIPKVTKKEIQDGMMAWRNLYRAIDKIWNERHDRASEG